MQQPDSEGGLESGNQVDRWQLVERLHLSPRTAVWRAIDPLDGRRAVLKFLRPAVPTVQELGHFRHEFEVAQRFEHPNVLRPLALASHDGRPYLVLPELAALSLQELARRAPLEGVEVVEIASALVEALVVIHRADVVHRNISPCNVLLPRDQAGRIRPTAALLTDFGIAAEISSERPLFVRADALEGALNTMSPEQTGRMSRDVDYRADFYSLGATLFEALTGGPVFAFDDAAQAVHAHLALPPPLATTRRAGAFAPLAAVINHCLQKEPEARYQSHRALLQDLNTCREALQAGRQLLDFVPGQGDHVGRFQLSGRLYGRERPMEQLTEAFEAAATGPCRLVAIAGFSGIGKTALVTAAHRSLLAQRGNFAAAKFNQFGQLVPYGALLACLAQRASQILALPPARQRVWQARLNEHLGVNAAVVSEALSEFHALLPDAPPVMPLGPLESENRFLRSLCLCLAALACEGEPQTLFLDDLQWADRASRRLLLEWVGSADLQHTLIVIAYRDNEVHATHPFAQDLQAFAELGPRFLPLSVGALNLGHTQELLADSLHRPTDEVAELAALCLAKTAGNPFFLRRFIEDLVQRRLLAFDAATERWDWSLAQIAQTQMAENAVELMVEQLAALPAATRHTLTVAAFLGASFDLDTLASMLSRSPAALAADLLPALQAQLLVPGSSLYRYAAQPDTAMAREVRYSFAHDRIQEATYGQVNADERMQLRLRIGRLLCRGLPAEAWPFDVVNHLNAALPLITAVAERSDLAQANAQASQQAMRSAAFELAADYADMAVQLHPADHWQTMPEALLDLHLHATRMAYLSGRMGTMETLLDAALAQTNESAGRARLLEVRIEAFFAQGELTEVLDQGLGVLAMLGAELPQAASPAEVVSLIAATRAELTAIGLPVLAALAPMTDARSLQVIAICTKMTAASYIVRPALLPLLTVLQVRLMLRHGHVPGALSAFSVLGLMFAEFLGDYQLAYDLGRLTMAQVQSQGWLQVYAHAGFSFNAFLRHWVEPLAQSLPGLKETYRNGLEFGNLRHAGLGLYVHDCHAFLAGQPLPALALSISEHLASLRAMRQPVAADYDSALLATVRQLMQPDLLAEALESAEFSGRALAAVYAARKDQTGLMFLHAWRALLHFLADRNAQALTEARAASQLFAAARGMHAVPMVVFIQAVTALRLSETTALADANAALQRMTRWNAAGPGNFAVKQQLLAAEIASAQGDDPLPQYRAAIASAGLASTGTPLDAGLAQVMLGRHLLRVSATNTTAAQTAHAQARLNFVQWGAVGVADALLLLPAPPRAANDEPKAEPPRTTHAVDLSSLMKAVQAITTEPDLPRLLQRLLQVVAENTGAQRAAIVLASGQTGQGGQGGQGGSTRRWTLQAEARLTGGEPVMPALGLEHIALEDAAAALPLGLLRRVLGSGRTRLIADACSNPLDASREPYFVDNNSRSVLSLALIKQGETVGALYLENDSAAGVFTERRVEFLELLCANVVNAVDNARLVDELQALAASLERRVEKRTQELRDSEARLRTILDNAPVAMTLTRRSDGVLIYANEAAARTINTQVADIVGRPALNFYRSAQDRQRLVAKYKAAGRLTSEEVCLLASDGGERWVLISMVDVRYNDGVADLATVVDITERKALEIELQRLATTDSLTGAANRRSFFDHATVEMARSKRHGFPLALVMMDIDHFKRINDTLGHAMGDAAIREVVRACSNLMRKQDLVGRLGGEEFALLLPQTELEPARLLVERLRETIASIGLHKDGEPVPGLTASFGVTVLRDGDQAVDDLLARADEALYAAKNAGRNRVISWS